MDKFLSLSGRAQVPKVPIATTPMMFTTQGSVPVKIDNYIRTESCFNLEDWILNPNGGLHFFQTSIAL